MIAHLRGTIGKRAPGVAVVDVNGVGYAVSMPLNDWDSVLEDTICLIHVSTYVREDRLDLYGFLDATTCALFEELIGLSGIGPKMGLELCAVPRSLLLQSIDEKDSRLLTSIKGIGKKSAEKLLVELSSLLERQPHLLRTSSDATPHARYDQDTVAALSQLGFHTKDILQVLESLPRDLTTTEERITAALRSL